METLKEGLALNNIKEVPKCHTIQTRYSSYDRVNEYVRHITKVFDNALNKSAEYDSSCIESINFKSKLPQINGKFKNSSFPTAQISKEIREKIAFFNAYNKIGQLKVSKSRFRAKSTVLSEESHKKKTERCDFSCFTEKKQRLCTKCNSSDCDGSCYYRSGNYKRYTEVESPLSAEIYLPKKKPPFVIRSMNSSYTLSMKKKRRSKLGLSFEDNNVLLLPRYLIK